MRLYDFQEKTIEVLLNDPECRICIAGCGLGKTIMGLTWAKKTGKGKVAIVTTASVRDAKNYEVEAKEWYPGWVESLDDFVIVSWSGLCKWLNSAWSYIDEYAFIFDEIDCAKAGIDSQRGKAFLQISKHTDTWSGWTATPGDSWLDFYAYFTACGKTRNRTDFQNRFCILQRFPFPQVLAYRNEDELKNIWSEISYAPDTDGVLAGLPDETHKTIVFKAPTKYNNCLKNHETAMGEYLSDTIAICHYLWQLCCTNKKLQWIEEFLEHLDGSCVIFYNYTIEGDKLEESVKKVLNKTSRIWRIDGRNHDIPVAETFGKKDVVLCQWASGGRGLNLQFINYWISVSPNYSYSLTLQGRKRIHRIGQTKKCHYYYLKCENTIEEDIYRALKRKADFSEENWVIQNLE